MGPDTDNLGSPRLIVNTTTGTIAQRLDYTSFGSTALDTNPGFQPFGYTGGLADPHTGLIHLGARDYDPTSGRFTTRDPAGIEGSGNNLYTYVGNDPINDTDPAGTFGIGSVYNFAAKYLNPMYPMVAGFFRYAQALEQGCPLLKSLLKAAAGTGETLLAVIPPAAILKAVKWARAARAARGAEDLAVACRTPNSFTADTPVLMASGTEKPIKSVQLGDKVMATDPETGESGPRKVTHLIRHGGPHIMVTVQLTNGTTINATDQHPFWVESRSEWVNAIELQVGDVVVTADGDQVSVKGLGIRQRDLIAYNLTVDGLHTYYAGETPILVHNSCPGVSWGGGHYRDGGYQNALEHIWTRHGYSSAARGDSAFAQGLGPRDIKALVDEALLKGTPNGNSIIVDMGRTIGTDRYGASTSMLQIFTHNGLIRTAYPL